VEDLVDQAVATLLVSLRIAPTFAFAPPFTLLRVPAIVRVILSIALAGWLVAGNPDATWRGPFWQSGLVVVAVAELSMGIALALALQLAFAALQTAGRAIDIQAGFGLALLVDPTMRTQVPLAGTLFAYAAGAVFFAMNGPADLLAIWAASIEQVPLGQAVIARDPGVLVDYMGTIFVMALGMAGLVLLVLFLLDLTVAFLSRTLPQMNVLLLGFQVKAIAMLVMLPIAIALSGSVFLRMMRYALETMPLLA
jgi:flagellar biosynthetic protein FliR